MDGAKMMNQFKNCLEFKRCVAISAALLFFSTNSLAQFDDFPPPPPDIDSFPQDNSFPPPENEFGGVPNEAPAVTSTPSSSLGNSANSNDNSAGGIISKSQKEKLAKASIDDINDQNFPDTIESFDFPNVDIQEIVKAISELTGKNFIIDPWRAW
jgi:general secretion pathway protein D